MQNEFIKQYKSYADIINMCYPDSNIMLEFSIDDLLQFFSNIAQSHWFQPSSLWWGGAIPFLFTCCEENMTIFVLSYCHDFHPIACKFNLCENFLMETNTNVVTAVKEWYLFINCREKAVVRNHCLNGNINKMKILLVIVSKITFWSYTRLGKYYFSLSITWHRSLGKIEHL